MSAPAMTKFWACEVPPKKSVSQNVEGSEDGEQVLHISQASLLPLDPADWSCVIASQPPLHLHTAQISLGSSAPKDGRHTLHITTDQGSFVLGHLQPNHLEAFAVRASLPRKLISLSTPFFVSLSPVVILRRRTSPLKRTSSCTTLGLRLSPSLVSGRRSSYLKRVIPMRRSRGPTSASAP